MVGNCDNCDRTNVPVSSGSCSSGETTQCYICQGDVADPYCEMLVDADWLRRKTETDPDLDCEALPSGSLARAIYAAKDLYLSPSDSVKAAHAAIEAWTCSGCGKPSPGRFRVCDCPTACVSLNGRSAWKIEPGPHKLAETIRTRLLGVAPGDQDAVLEDSDWRIILAALLRC